MIYRSNLYQELQPGMKVRVIDTRATLCKMWEIGTLLRRGRDPDSGKPAGWVVKFPFSLRRLVIFGIDHLFDNQLEIVYHGQTQTPQSRKEKLEGQIL